MNSREKRAVKKLVKTKYGMLVLVVVVIAAAIISHFDSVNQAIDPNADVEFHFIDVGQGDAAMILTDEVTVVIDCGTTDSSDELTEYISQYADTIDCLIFSHAHEDHMGGAASVINSFEIGQIIMTEYASDSAFFERALDVIEEKDVKVTEAVVGGVYTVGDIEIEVFSPVVDYGDFNNNSIVLRAEVDGASAVFTGDAETKAEEDILESFGYKLSANILKMGHHGSSTSTCDEFFSAVDPEIAVISCGENNSYGHPHRETLSLLKNSGIPYYRTDEIGTVVLVCSNGEITAR